MRLRLATTPYGSSMLHEKLAIYEDAQSVAPSNIYVPSTRIEKTNRHDFDVIIIRQDIRFLVSVHQMFSSSAKVDSILEMTAVAMLRQSPCGDDIDQTT